MNNNRQSELLAQTVCLRQALAGSDLNGVEILGLFGRVHVANNFVYDGRLGGFVKHGRRIIKRNFY